MSAFGGKADMAFCGFSLSRSLLGVKQTCRFAAHMSAFDPKRTSARKSKPGYYDAFIAPWSTYHRRADNLKILPGLHNHVPWKGHEPQTVISCDCRSGDRVLRPEPCVCSPAAKTKHHSHPLR